MSSPIKNEISMTDDGQSENTSSSNRNLNNRQDFFERPSGNEENETQIESFGNLESKHLTSELPGNDPDSIKTDYKKDKQTDSKNDLCRTEIANAPENGHMKGKLLKSDDLNRKTHDDTMQDETYQCIETNLKACKPSVCESLENLNTPKEASEESHSPENSDFELGPVDSSSSDTNAYNSPLAEDVYGPRTNLTDYADISDTTSDGTDHALRIQRKRKKKQKVTSQSENESYEEGRSKKSCFFFPIQNDDSTKGDESTTTDDVTVTPFEPIGLEKDIYLSSSENLPSTVDEQDSENAEATDGSISSKSDNSETPDEESLENRSLKPETFKEQSSANKPDKLEKLDEQALENEPDQQEACNELSPTNKTFNPETFDEKTSANDPDKLEKFVEEASENESRQPEESDEASIKVDNAEALNEMNSSNETDNPEAPDKHISGIESVKQILIKGNAETFGDESSNNASPDNGRTPNGNITMDIIGNEEIFQSVTRHTSTFRGNRTYESESNFEISSDEPQNQSLKPRKRKLSIIYEETAESRQAAKRLRECESNDEI